jgi:hypothetical protein
VGDYPIETALNVLCRVGSICLPIADLDDVEKMWARHVGLVSIDAASRAATNPVNAQVSPTRVHGSSFVQGKCAVEGGDSVRDLHDYSAWRIRRRASRCIAALTGILGLW